MAIRAQQSEKADKILLSGIHNSSLQIQISGATFSLCIPLITNAGSSAFLFLFFFFFFFNKILLFRSNDLDEILKLTSAAPLGASAGRF